MKMTKLFFVFLFLFNIAHGQFPQNGNFIFAKDYSKEFSLYYAKSFVAHNILENKGNVLKFEIDPLAAASSGELTTLVYKCPSQNKRGLVLGFYGSRWNDAGVNFLSYAFKDLPIIKANEFIAKIESAVTENAKYLNEDLDNNNISFNYDDIKILIYAVPSGFKLRIFWNDFDSDWYYGDFKKTQKRLPKKLK